MNNERIRRMIAKRLDQEMTALMTGTVSSSPEALEPLTVDKLLHLVLKTPKRETWVSTRHYPGSDALRIEASGEDFMVAHPMFWARLEHELCRDRVPPNPLLPPFAGVKIIEIDPHPTNTPERRLWLEDIWRRLKEAIEIAGVPLPDWLKTPAKFGKHE